MTTETLKAIRALCVGVRDGMLAPAALEAVIERVEHELATRSAAKGRRSIKLVRRSGPSG